MIFKEEFGSDSTCITVEMGFYFRIYTYLLSSHYISTYLLLVFTSKKKVNGVFLWNCC